MRFYTIGINMEIIGKWEKQKPCWFCLVEEMKQKGNKQVIVIQLALKFVDEHRELFEKWIEEKKRKGEIK